MHDHPLPVAVVGAPAVVYLTEATTSGRYYDRTRQVRSSPPSYDEAAAARLWQVSEDVCGAFDRA